MVWNCLVQIGEGEGLPYEMGQDRPQQIKIQPNQSLAKLHQASPSSPLILVRKKPGKKGSMAWKMVRRRGWRVDAREQKWHITKKTWPVSRKQQEILGAPAGRPPFVPPGLPRAPGRCTKEFLKFMCLFLS